MVFSPCKRSLRIADVFPTFILAGCTLAFVAHFKYLGHVIENSLSDDQDINREIKLLFTRTNVLIRRFKRCSTLVKIRLFRSCCLCFYGFALYGLITPLASLTGFPPVIVSALNLFLVIVNIAVSHICFSTWACQVLIIL